MCELGGATWVRRERMCVRHGDGGKGGCRQGNNGCSGQAQRKKAEGQTGPNRCGVGVVFGALGLSLDMDRHPHPLLHVPHHLEQRLCTTSCSFHPPP